MSEIRLPIRLTPKASRNAIGEWVEDSAGQRYLKVNVTTVPEKGKANKALIALLAREWRLPKNVITIIKGETDRNKIVLIQNIDEKTAQIILK
jgi:uncharacterized protein (TIGR00251 family)